MSDSQNSTLVTDMSEGSVKFHGDDNTQEDSESMGLGEVVEIGDRLQEEQVLTENKEQSSISPYSVNHVCETHPNIGTAAEPSTKIFSKSLSRSDIESRLSVPTSSLPYLPVPEGENTIQFQALDTLGEPWIFRLQLRDSGSYNKPVISGQWNSFVKEKGAKVGDIVTLFQESYEGKVTYRIKVSRRIFNVLANVE